MDKNEKARIDSIVELDEEALSKINAYTLREYTADELFAFKICMCDNDIDRDREAFSVGALKKMAELFKGKTVIFNHSSNAKDQTARIYETEVMTDTEKTNKFGEPYVYLRAYAYTVKSEKNEAFIENILAGITKEVSVAVRVASISCNICGHDVLNNGRCRAHTPGEVYEGKLCANILDNVKDAYEVSFVAIPAQPQAGTTKSYEDKPADEAEPAAAPEPTTAEPSFAEKILNLIGGNK